MNQNSLTPPMTLYGIVPYDRSGKVRWLMRELGLDFKDHWLNRDEKEHEGEAFLQINPLGRIPVMKWGERVIFESSAICAYLADFYLHLGLAPPLESPARMDYQQWMYFAASTLDTFVVRIMIIEDIPPGDVFTDKEKALLGDLTDALGVLETAFTNQDFLVNGVFSVADICVAYHLYWCKLWPEFDRILNAHPKVVAYLDRMQERKAAVDSKVFSYEG